MADPEVIPSFRATSDARCSSSHCPELPMLPHAILKAHSKRLKLLLQPPPEADSAASACDPRCSCKLCLTLLQQRLFRAAAVHSDHSRAASDLSCSCSQHLKLRSRFRYLTFSRNCYPRGVPDRYSRPSQSSCCRQTPPVQRTPWRRRGEPAATREPKTASPSQAPRPRSTTRKSRKRRNWRCADSSGRKLALARP